MKRKLTPWFPAEVKPVHVGVYEIMSGSVAEENGYAYWNGKRWGYSYDVSSSFALKNAYRDREMRGCWARGRKWRGLAVKP